MSLSLQLEGHPGQAFADLIRALPDGRSWLLSDLEGRVVIARYEGEELVREAILSEGEDGLWDVECLVSKGVTEAAVIALVGGALLSCISTIVWVWFYGPPGLLGLMLGLVLASTVPSGVIAIGRYLVDPGREPRAERNLERAIRFAAASVASAKIVNTAG